jgi:predicted enzyme related to lactoylglutathione lyase
MDLRLELVSVPLTDVDRAKAFYVDQVGFGVEQDVQVDENHRFVELMPPGSPCSIALTTGYIDSQPGCLKGVQRSTSRTSMRCTHSYAIVMLKCPRSRTTPEGRFCFFSDPDGNGWSVHGPLHPE